MPSAIAFKIHFFSSCHAMNPGERKADPKGVSYDYLIYVLNYCPPKCVLLIFNRCVVKLN